MTAARSLGRFSSRTADVAQFAATLAREFHAAHPNMVGDVAAKLISLGATQKRLAEAYCNGTVSTNDYSFALAKARQYVAECLAMLTALPTVDCLLMMEIGGDPRGCTLKIKLPSGRTDDMAQEGFCVPGS